MIACNVKCNFRAEEMRQNKSLPKSTKLRRQFRQFILFYYFPGQFESYF